MAFQFDIINIFLLTVLVLTFLLGLIAFNQQRENLSNREFFVFTLSASAWVACMLLFRGIALVELKAGICRMLYVSAAIIPVLFINFIDKFPENSEGLNKYLLGGLIIPFMAILFICLSPDLLIQNIISIKGSEPIIVFNQFYHSIYAIYIIVYFNFAYFLLFSKYKKAEGVFKTHIKYIILGTLISTVIGVLTNLVLPYFGHFQLNWLGQIGIIAMIGSISYAIIEYKLFNIKVILSQFITYLFWVLLFVRILFSTSPKEFLLNALFLLIAIGFGIWLIQSVLKLEKANEKLKELDKLKTEFLSLASHQLRSPLTAIKGYSSMMLQDSFGKIENQELRSAIDKIFQCSVALSKMVEDFLSVTKIEQGGMKFIFTLTDVGKIVKEVSDELSLTAKDKGLEFVCDIDNKAYFNINADGLKLRQVFVNLIDNATKYTKEGFIKVKLEKNNNKIIFSVSDSGMGLTAETKAKLFQKFERGEGQRMNSGGSGLGLYLAKQIVEAHNGSIKIDSPGLMKGTTFTVEIPSSIA